MLYEMKFKAKIEGTRVHEVGYRTFLMTEVLFQGIRRFAAFNLLENGKQVVMVLVEGDEGQTAAFKEFLQNKRPNRAIVSSVTFEDFEGRVMSVFEFSQLNLNDQLNKGIPALLRIDEKQDKMLGKQDKMLEKQDKMLQKQDQMLEKQDSMLEKQDKMIEEQDMMLQKQDATIAVLKEVKEDTSCIKNDISSLRKDASETLYEKYEQLSREIAEIKATLSEIKAKAA